MGFPNPANSPRTGDAFVVVSNSTDVNSTFDEPGNFKLAPVSTAFEQYNGQMTGEESEANILGNSATENMPHRTASTAEGPRKPLLTPALKKHKQPNNSETSRSRDVTSSFRSFFSRKKDLLTISKSGRSRENGGGSGGDGDSSDPEADDDPVLALFQARTTQRVRFALESSATHYQSNVVSGAAPTNNQQPAAVRSERQADPFVNGTEQPSTSSMNIKKFVQGALFGTNCTSKEDSSDKKCLKTTSTSSSNADNIRAEENRLFQQEAAKEIEDAKQEDKSGMEWEGTVTTTRTQGHAQTIKSPSANRHSISPSQTGQPSAFHTTAVTNLGESFTEDSMFVEDLETRARVIKLLNKAKRAQFVHFKYEYSVKCCVRALELLDDANYPDDHLTVLKTLQSLNSAHHALSSYKNSANIVKMGIRYEDQGDLVRALKMYTIAYRIRRDNLSPMHPSLIVLLNMLGSIQTKRGELEEAMEIYELSLKDDDVVTGRIKTTNNKGLGDDFADEDHRPRLTSNNVIAKSVAYREIGTIYERWGETEIALQMYHKSLDCIAEYRRLSFEAPNLAISDASGISSSQKKMDSASPTSVSDRDILLDLESVQFIKSFSKQTTICKANKYESDGDESGGMELLISAEGATTASGSSSKDKICSKPKTLGLVTTSSYDVFFPHNLDREGSNRKKRSSKGRSLFDASSYADVDIALTLHQIGQLHRAEGEYNLALAAYIVALRGMRYALGKSHPNVAAILGNIGNLQKEMGDMNAAFETYQQVLSIESHRLGLAHPDVAVTLHNIATIDASRGHYEHALMLYRQVMALQQKLFGDDDDSIAITSACMGDVYERIGDIVGATECFEEALRVKTATMGRHSLDVARLLHKLSKLSVARGDYHLADSFISRTVLVYRLNKLPDDDEWLVDANRDAADIDAAITMGRGVTFEC